MVRMPLNTWRHLADQTTSPASAEGPAQPGDAGITAGPQLRTGEAGLRSPPEVPQLMTARQVSAPDSATPNATLFPLSCCLPGECGHPGDLRKGKCSLAQAAHCMGVSLPGQGTDQGEANTGRARRLLELQHALCHFPFPVSRPTLLCHCD